MKTTREQAKKTVMRSPRRFGKSTLITDKFLSACEKGESVEFRHPKYICMSLKRLQHLLDKEREGLIKKWEESTVLEFKRYIDTLKPKEIK